MKHAARTVSLGLVLTCALATMAVGAIAKSPCASGEWTDLRQYRLLCYTDVVPLLDTEQLAGGRLPFLQPCEDRDGNCDEYPVLTMWVMRAAAWVSGIDHTRFFWANALILGFAAGVTAACLWLLAGRRALWFALAPTLLIYGTVNWDLVAVAFATGALVAFAARRDGWAGVLLGLGAATKFYPALLVLPLFLQAIQDREPDRAVRVLWWSAGTWLAVNLPFAAKAPSAWWEFFRFNGARVPDFDSVWHIACRWVDAACLSTGVVNLGAAVAFVAVSGLLWWWKARRTPGFSRWTLGFPLIVVFLLANKVYSPQYGLWLLPWFALVGPDLRRFVAFEIADIAVFVTRFRFFAEYVGGEGYPQWAFEAAVALRFAVLIWCLAGWLKNEPQPLALGSRGWRTNRGGPPPKAVPT